MSSIFLESENFDFENTRVFRDNWEKNTKKTWSDTVKFSFQKELCLGENLKNLLTSMKPSFLTREQNPQKIRQIFLWNPHENPMILLKKGDESVLIGTGFSQMEFLWNNLFTFPDLRLPFSEIHRLKGWIILEENIDLERFSMIAYALDFPVIFSTKKIIEKIQANIAPEYREKMRFCEIFSENPTLQNIASIEFFSVQYQEKKILGFRVQNQIFAYSHTEIFDNFPAQKMLFVPIFSGKIGEKSFSEGEIVSFFENDITTETMKFTFDTFYLDKKSIGTTSEYVFSDRKALSEGGVVIFTLEEDRALRTIAGHIFIDSRGFVHSYEMMKIHKEILKAVRTVYEQTIEQNPQISRKELVCTFREKIAEFCAQITGRTPIIMPIILEKKYF